MSAIHENIDKARAILAPAINEATGADIHPAAISTALSSLLGEFVAQHWPEDQHEGAFKQLALNLRHAIVNYQPAIILAANPETLNGIKH